MTAEEPEVIWAEQQAQLYRERAHLIAHLAAVYPAVIGTDPGVPGWPVVYIGLAEGQVSWHVSPADMDLFAHVPRGPDARWDGHSVAEKYARLDRATTRRSVRGFPYDPAP